MLDLHIPGIQNGSTEAERSMTTLRSMIRITSQILESERADGDRLAIMILAPTASAISTYRTAMFTIQLAETQNYLHDEDIKALISMKYMLHRVRVRWALAGGSLMS